MAVEFWHFYLLGHVFTIITDNAPLKAVQKFKVGSRLFSWRMQLRQYTFRIEYIPGRNKHWGWFSFATSLLTCSWKQQNRIRSGLWRHDSRMHNKNTTLVNYRNECAILATWEKRKISVLQGRHLGKLLTTWPCQGADNYSKRRWGIEPIESFEIHWSRHFQLAHILHLFWQFHQITSLLGALWMLVFYTPNEGDCVAARSMLIGCRDRK